MKDSVPLIIFDCDGVLVDSEIIGIELTVSLLNAQGVDIGRDEFAHRYSGLAWDELINQIRTDKGVTISPHLRQAFHPLLMNAFADGLVSIAGVRETLSQITIPHCICSNSSAEQLDIMLTKVGLKPFFTPHIFSAVDLGPGRGKPRPDIFLHAARVMNAAPENTLVIEDSVHGVTAAKRAGMFVVGFTGGAHTTPDHRTRLYDAGADRVINAMPQLITEIRHFKQCGTENNRRNR
ncbi:HAD family hydrolase [Lonsdalea britannica]|uniref:HAD family hydrolase n=1 Tax=Lonsdalea britannica TaxID=1082704 RepID=UPI000A1F89A4|nr:HAD family hydrolase [Lonsdalea britannica]